MIEIGLLKNFDSGTYKAGVQLAGSLTTYLDDIPVSVAIPPSGLVVGNRVILAIPGGNPKDTCVIATWPQGTPGTFLGLSDTPSSYSGQAGKGLKVNDVENALEFGYKPRAFVEGWTSGMLLKGAGVDADPGEARLKDFLYACTANYILFEPWKNLDGWTEDYVGTGAKSLAIVRLELSTGITINSRASLYTTAYCVDHPHYANIDAIFQRIQATTNLADSTIKAYLCRSGTSIPPSDISQHGGFKIINGEIWATNADGTTETATDTGVSIATAWQSAQLRLIGTGSSIQFYVNGNLRAEHNTNLPQTYNYFIYIGITNEAASNKGIRVRPIVVHG